MVSVSHTVFESNKVGGIGGAIYLQNPNSYECSYCYFSNNTAAGNELPFATYLFQLPFILLMFKSNPIGGAIYILNSTSVKISKSSFKNNIGSALTLTSCANVNVIDSQFHNNSTPLDGGAINAFGSDAFFQNVLFTENNAKGNGGSVFFLSSETLTFSKCHFSRNTASHQGGGIWSQTSKLTIYNSDFYSNSATANAGGALFTSDGSPPGDLSLSSCTFRRNFAQTVGGAISSRETNASIFVNNSSFEKNMGSVGGAIIVVDSAVFVERSLFADNGDILSFIVLGMLSISRTTFLSDSVVCGLTSKEQCKIKTYISVYKQGIIKLKSSDTNFKEKALGTFVISKSDPFQ